MQNNILFVCQGNVGRSQIAEGFYNHYTKDTLGISAGIDDVGAKYNYQPYPPLVYLMKKDYDIDISKQSVKQITKEMVQGANKIIILCIQEECRNPFPTFVLQHPHVNYIPISDPHHKGEQDLQSIVQHIKKIIENII